MGERERILVVDAGPKRRIGRFHQVSKLILGCPCVCKPRKVCLFGIARALTRSAEERGSFDSPKSKSRGSRRAKTAPIVGNS